MAEPQYVTQDQLDKRLEKTDGKIDLIHRGLFVDNGSPATRRAWTEENECSDS